MTPQILHVDLDAFFVSVEQALRPELVGRPAVVGGHPDGRGVVTCASYEARAYGIRAGMPVATARHLCPQAIFLPGSFARYREYSARFLDILGGFSPLLEPCGLDEAYLDITGFEPLYGVPRQTALRIKARIRQELQLCASIGIASVKVVAKVASDLSKPDGLVEVPHGQEREFLAPLPVERLPGVGPRTQRVLSRIGVSTIGHLAALPVQYLTHRLGSYGEMIHRHANGMDEGRVEPRGPAKSLSREMTLEADTSDRQVLKAALRHLVERVGADIRSRGMQARCITLKLRYADFNTISRNLTLRAATDINHTVFETVDQMLETALARRKQAVRLIGVRLSNLVGESRQLEMPDEARHRWACLDQAVDRIRQRYGFDAIETGQTLPLKGPLHQRGQSQGSRKQNTHPL